MDVKSAFFNSDLKEDVYVHQQSGFAIPDKKGKVLRMCKTLYGLRQALRAWNAKFPGKAEIMLICSVCSSCHCFLLAFEKENGTSIPVALLLLEKFLHEAPIDI
jgi:hypothetical protein